MEILLILGGIWFVGGILGWWEKRPPQATPEQLLQEQYEREQRARELQTRIEQQRVEREQQEAERREEWQRAYGEYLRSEEWKRVRQRVFKRAEYKCEFCGEPAEQVHHMRYPKSFRRMNFTRENMSYLKAICRDCHREQHGL